MSDLLNYKGYYGTVEYSASDNCLFGKILGINGLYLYEGQDLSEVRDDFESMVDSYLEECKQNGREPEKPYKGSFNVRVSPELHRAAALYAVQRGITLNSLVERALRKLVEDSSQFGCIACDSTGEYKPKRKKDYI